MDAHRAYALGIDPDAVNITTEGRRYGRNMWVAWVPDDRPERGGRYVCTQSRDVFDLTRWLSDLREFYMNECVECRHAMDVSGRAEGRDTCAQCRRAAEHAAL